MIIITCVNCMEDKYLTDNDAYCSHCSEAMCGSCAMGSEHVDGPVCDDCIRSENELEGALPLF